jgi:hypothetical protein
VKALKENLAKDFQNRQGFARILITQRKFLEGYPKPDNLKMKKMQWLAQALERI